MGEVALACAPLQLADDVTGSYLLFAIGGPCEEVVDGAVEVDAQGLEVAVADAADVVVQEAVGGVHRKPCTSEKTVGVVDTFVFKYPVEVKFEHNGFG